MGAAGTLAESVCHSPTLFPARLSNALAHLPCSSEAAQTLRGTNQVAQMSVIANGLAQNQKLARHEACLGTHDTFGSCEGCCAYNPQHFAACQAIMIQHSATPCLMLLLQSREQTGQNMMIQPQWYAECQEDLIQKAT